MVVGMNIKSRLLLTLGLITGMLGVASVPESASAACAPPSPSYGSASLQLTVTTAGTYRVWTHMNAPDATNNSYLLEVDGGNCYVVGDGATPADTWNWIDYQNGNTTSKISLSLTAGTHTLKAIGREPNVKLDRILLASDQNCLPTGFGDNCMVLADTTKPVTTITMPEDLSTVKGQVPVKATASDASGIAKVEFYVQDALKSTDTSAPYEYTWDTNQIADGVYTLTAKSFDPAGNSSFDAQSVTVKNTEVILPPAPVNITANATQPTQVALQWQAGTGASADLKYRIIRGGIALATVSGLSYADTTVVAGTKYDYYVVAVDKNNNVSSLPAKPTTVTTPPLPAKDTQAPTKPTKLVARAAGTSQINLSWQASTDAVGVKSYDVYRAEKDKDATKVATVGLPSYGDTGLKSGTIYTYYVIARDAAGNVSAASDRTAVATNDLPRPPQRKSVIRGTVRSSTGRPLAGVKVMLWSNGKRYQATTNWRGQYRISGLPTGAYEVKFKAKGYKTASFDIKLGAGKTKWLDVTLRR